MTPQPDDGRRRRRTDPRTRPRRGRSEAVDPGTDQDAAPRPSEGHPTRSQETSTSSSAPRGRARALPAGRGRTGRPPAGVARPRRSIRPTDLTVPDDVTGRELDIDVRRQLRTLPTDLATKVARHLVMAGRLVDENPDEAFRHAVEARRLVSRVPAVREAAGLSAYHAGRYAEALTELRAATRMSGRPDLLPLIADAERGVGRPERALALAASEEVTRLSTDGRVEMAIVAAGARRDLDQPEAAVVALQIPELRSAEGQPWFARLAYAYAEALHATGRHQEALSWLDRVVAADPQDITGAAEWWEGLHGVTFVEDPDGDVPD